MIDGLFFRLDCRGGRSVTGAGHCIEPIIKRCQTLRNARAGTFIFYAITRNAPDSACLLRRDDERGGRAGLGEFSRDE